jgi:hypothetical protein
MFSMLQLSFVAFLPWLSFEVTSRPAGVNKATFDKIKVGMTAQQIQALIGRGKAANLFVQYHYSQQELWSDESDTRRIWVEYEPTVAVGKVARASFEDYSTTPPTELELRRVATKAECAAAIDRLLGDGLTKKPLGHSDAFTKEIPINARRAKKVIEDHPNYQSYHLLMALRKTNPKAYKKISAKVRASVLCSTLKEQTFFDDWMAPECETVKAMHVTDSEKALVECGLAAIPNLLPLLDDHTEACDSENEEEPDYEYRRADYAFRYASWILNLAYSFQAEPSDRDKDIATLKRKLAGRFSFGVSHGGKDKRGRESN